MLPDDDSLVFRHIHAIAFLDVECLIELREVSHLHVGAIVARRMDVDSQKEFCVFGTGFRAPDAGEVEEEGGVVGLGDVPFHGLEGRGDAAIVGNVLADDELAVDLSVKKRQAIELLDHGRGLLLEGLVILLRPPVVDVSELVHLGAVVVKGMADFVSDDGSDSAIVFLRLLGKTIERGLEDGGREGDVVVAGVVAGIDKMGIHDPARPIDRLGIEGIGIAASFDDEGIDDLGEGEIGGEGQRIIGRIDLVRIADLENHLGQLDAGLFARLLA